MKKRIFTYISIGFALALLFVFVKPDDFGKIYNIVKRIGLIGFILFFLNNVMVILMPTLGWWMLMRAEKLKIGFRDCLDTSIMGFTINVMTPSMYLGGEPIKVYYIGNRYGIPKRRVLASIIVGKVQEITALVVLLIASGWIMLHKYSEEIAATDSIGQGLITTSLVIIAVLVLVCLMAFLGKMKPTVRIINILIFFGIARRKMVRLRKRAAEMEDLIHEAFTERWRSTIAAGLVTSLSAISIFLRPAIFYWFLSGQANLTIPELCAIYLITQLILVVQITPGGVGLYEGGLVIAFELIGRTRPEALAFAALVRFTDVFLASYGAWLMTHHGMRHVARIMDREESAQNDTAEAPKESNEEPPKAESA